ncbi:hypothetical protein AB0G81_32910, partial [Streptomyces asoensis]
GPSAVLHAIADHVVDDYLNVIDAVQMDIDQVRPPASGPAPWSGRALSGLPALAGWTRGCGVGVRTAPVRAGPAVVPRLVQAACGVQAAPLRLPLGGGRPLAGPRPRGAERVAS